MHASSYTADFNFVLRNPRFLADSKSARFDTFHPRHRTALRMTAKESGAYFGGELDAGGTRGADAGTAIEREPFLPTERTAKK